MAVEEPKLDEQEIMLVWALKMLDMIKILSLVDHLKSSALKITIGTAMLERGTKYCLGNPNIENHLRHWIEREKAKRHEQVNISIHLF